MSDEGKEPKRPASIEEKTKTFFMCVGILTTVVLIEYGLGTGHDTPFGWAVGGIILFLLFTMFWKS